MFSNGREVQIAGLSGLQYREFFTMLLPLYEQFGVPGAAAQLTDPCTRRLIPAVRRRRRRSEPAE
jgi:hypothetical protein